MLILGIESSCDETAASVARNHTEILSNVVSSQVEEHKQYGGVVPEIASRRHCENVLPVVQKALDDAGVTLAELDGIAVTAYPGLIGALLVGVNFAKGLALTAGKPLVPTHHLAGHIAANYIAQEKDTASAAGILGAHAGIIGCIQAMEALKYLAGIPSPLVGAMLSADTRRMRFTTIPLAPNPACRCRTNAGCGAAMKN